MIFRHFGSTRRGLAWATIVALAVSQASAGPASARIFDAAVTGAAAVAVEHSHNEAVPKAATGQLAPVSDGERQAYGCLVGAGTAAAFTVLGGATETVLVVAGGMLRPTNSVVLWTALAGTVLSAVCAASALATPGVLRLWDYYYNGARPAPQ